MSSVELERRGEPERRRVVERERARRDVGTDKTAWHCLGYCVQALGIHPEREHHQRATLCDERESEKERAHAPLEHPLVEQPVPPPLLGERSHLAHRPIGQLHLPEDALERATGCRVDRDLRGGAAERGSGRPTSASRQQDDAVRAAGSTRQDVGEEARVQEREGGERRTHEREERLGDLADLGLRRVAVLARDDGGHLDARVVHLEDGGAHVHDLAELDGRLERERVDGGARPARRGEDAPRGDRRHLLGPAHEGAAEEDLLRVGVLRAHDPEALRAREEVDQLARLGEEGRRARAREREDAPC